MKMIVINCRLFQISLMVVLCLMCGQTKAQLITTIARTGTFGYTGDGGSTIAPDSKYTCWITKDAPGSLYFGDWDGSSFTTVIRKIKSLGIITRFAGIIVPGYSRDGGPATGARINGGGFCFDEREICIYVAITA
jgi:hypothetical protein